jgi:hypothetical protein
VFCRWQSDSLSVIALDRASVQAAQREDDGDGCEGAEAVDVQSVRERATHTSKSTDESIAHIINS